MQAVVLAGGQGIQLAPFTNVLPKLLMSIGNIPILEMLLWQMKSAGFDGVIISVDQLQCY
jgi:NDP-sugar pyrophosphorylase family protein